MERLMKLRILMLTTYEEINETKNFDVNSNREWGLRSLSITLPFSNFLLVPQNQQSLEHFIGKYEKLTRCDE